MGVGWGEGRSHEESSAPATVRRHKNEEKDSVLGQWKRGRQWSIPGVQLY